MSNSKNCPASRGTDWKLEIENWKFYVIYVLYAIFGLLPSFIWLLFYLRKDRHPEPNGMVTKIFIWGMLIGPLAILLELFSRWLMSPNGLADFGEILRQNSKNYLTFINIIIAAPIIEELLKYAVVRFRVLKNSEFDEPLDAMLYMIIAALGFAAVENLLLVFQNPLPAFGSMLSLIALRFISATFVHALSSGMIGFWLAKSIKEPGKKYSMLAKGFGLAIFFHSGYNALIWIVESQKNTAISYLPIFMIFILIGIMAIAVSHKFAVLKRLHAVCRICKVSGTFLKNT